MNKLLYFQLQLLCGVGGGCVTAPWYCNSSLSQFVNIEHELLMTRAYGNLTSFLNKRRRFMRKIDRFQATKSKSSYK